MQSKPENLSNLQINLCGIAQQIEASDQPHGILQVYKKNAQQQR